MAQPHDRTRLPGRDAPIPPLVAAPRPKPAIAPHARAHEILRFRKTERMVHWTIAIPFLTCLTTAITMVAMQGRLDHLVLRATISWIHRISGICLIVLPFAAVFRSKGDLRIHIYNVRQAWIWTLSDVKWLAVAGAAAISKKVALPEQGKFNAAEKLNFMVLMGTYPFYVVTGLTIWLTHNAFLSWVVHVAIALMGAPLILGHIYMATINPSSRVGLQGMITGFVDRHWARHHYRRWYEEHFEETAAGGSSRSVDHAMPQPAWHLHGAHVLCGACSENFDLATDAAAGDVPAGSPLHCPRCGAAICRLDAAPAPDQVEAALSGVKVRGGAAGMLSEALIQCEETSPTPPTSGSFVGIPVAPARGSAAEDSGRTKGPKASDARG